MHSKNFFTFTLFLLLLFVGCAPPRFEVSIEQAESADPLPTLAPMPPSELDPLSIEWLPEQCGQVIWQDTFEQDRDLWTIGEISDGALRLDSKHPEPANLDTTIKGIATTNNYCLFSQIDVTHLVGDGRLVYKLLHPEGHYRIRLNTVDNIPKYLVNTYPSKDRLVGQDLGSDWPNSDAFRLRSGERISVVLVVNGDLVEFYANGEKLDEFNAIHGHDNGFRIGLQSVPAAEIAIAIDAVVITALR